MHPEPNDLLIFVRVVEEGSFSRAAQRLAVPLSTISRRINKLETRLGERLLLRNTRKVKVSDLGHAVLEHARHVVEGVEAAAAVADNRQVQPRGRLRICMPGDLGLLGPFGLLGSFLAEFASTHPSMVLELDLTARLPDPVAEGFDVAFQIGELRDDALFVARQIVHLHSGLYASPSYLNNRGMPHAPADLVNHEALHPVRNYNERASWLLRRGDQSWQGSPRRRVIADSPELLVTMSIHGGGIVAAHDNVVEPHVQAGYLLRVLPEWTLPTVPLWAIFPSRRLMPTRARVFIDALTARLGPPTERTQRDPARRDICVPTCASA